MRAHVPPRVVTEPLGGSPLARGVQERRLPETLQPPMPASVPEWRDHVERARSRADAGWYERVRPAIAPGGAAAARLEAVVAAGGVLVTTGQQAALFGGPLYTLAKALTARALADAIEQQLGVPAAPLFWAATDDADFLEASVVHVADAEGLHELKLASRPPAGTILSATPLPRREMQALLAELRRACGSAANAAFADLAGQFAAGRTMGSGYVTLMRALLEPLGIAVFDASHDGYREAARPLLAEALHRSGEISAVLAETGSALRSAGYEPQVLDERGLSLVFEVADGAKRRLALTEAASAAARTTDLAPNVLLRPLVERELVPTVAYVAGPGELAYFTQANAVARAMDRAALVAVPRWSCTVIEAFTARALSRLGVDWQEVRDIHALERRLAVAGLPPDVAASWKRLRERLHDSVRDFAAAVQKNALLPGPVVEGLERSIEHRLARGERRLLAAAKRRDAQARRDLQVAHAALFPLGSRQERVLNFVPMLARGGDALLSGMSAAAADHARGMMGAVAREAVAAL